MANNLVDKCENLIVDGKLKWWKKYVEGLCKDERTNIETHSITSLEEKEHAIKLAKVSIEIIKLLELQG